MKEIEATVLQNEPIACGIRRLTFRMEEDIRVRAGQFVHVGVGGMHLLRRPIAVCKQEGRDITVCFQIKGEGTRLLAKKQAGERLSALLPLGNGFTMTDGEQTVALIGGGVGIFPMISCLREFQAKGKRVNAYIGFRNRDAVCMLDELEKADRLVLATDDGSFGKKGNAVQIWLDDLSENLPDVVFACGPTPMLRALKGEAEKRSIPCFVSLEERMGCGIGACLVCVCDRTDGKRARVCKDGPVFDVRDVKL